ncbi:MAG: polysaccharide deacetylase family protein [Euryarchaeota archaeon]|nr:polysaccharide deacetylase family protein [Euryarchaeota archaeon]
MLPAALRVDIDTLGDILALEPLLELLERLEVRASFFVAMGPDRCGRNLRNYLHQPWKLLNRELWRSHRLSHLLRSMLVAEHMEEHAESLHVLRELGHEAGLHGYDHYTWMRRAEKMSLQEAAQTISLGVAAFRQVFGHEPGSFASPGFRTSRSCLQALDSFGFSYASDFTGYRAFYPKFGDWRAETLQVPVCMLSPCELSSSDRAVLQELERQLERAESHFCFYIHPSREVHRLKLVERMLRRIESYGAELLTLAEIAERLKATSAVQEL